MVYASVRTLCMGPCAPTAGRVTAGRGRLAVNKVLKEARMTRTANHPEPDLTGAQRAAWDTYRDSLGDLRGKEYEEAELISWDELQRTLAELAEHERTPA
jgi:hypothetical protein